MTKPLKSWLNCSSIILNNLLIMLIRTSGKQHLPPPSFRPHLCLVDVDGADVDRDIDMRQIVAG